ncbi:MAG: DUF5522 domain-containing protein [Cyclobacteriaceae bacterium]|nr:DUF5522 domain-containing protein [Cyclobacteriaceae bacterium]MDH4295435.1 DUF5522 domain-containing protein [Cyclobacteriaceae bacterium]MDH5249648.1 DUF5522 domain-containing protein [Cyclobacteriaceae bacterium]
MSSSDEHTGQNANVDYFYMENGLAVFTAAYHLQRGYCCENECRHCPYRINGKEGDPSSAEK